MLMDNVGESIPANTPHAVSVSLPTWKANVGYEEGEGWVVDKLSTGYPRFFIHKLITAFAEDISRRYGNEGQLAMLFPSPRAARRCVDFINTRDPPLQASHIQVVELVLDPNRATPETLKSLSPSISTVLLPKECFSIAKQYWQHSGDGISSRRAEFCHRLFREGLLVELKTLDPTSRVEPRFHRGPKRYQQSSSSDKTQLFLHKNQTDPSSPTKEGLANGGCEILENLQFIEERFGRNLDISFFENAKSALRRRIAGSLTSDVDLRAPMTPIMGTSSREEDLSEGDVYLYSCGMNSIFNAHQMMLEARGPLKSIMFGFPYIDTLKVLEKFGPGCLFYGHGSSEDLEDLEMRLESGERYLALFCELPSNPLLKTPDFRRIKKLAEDYNFGVVVDETIGNFINVHVLSYSDIVVSSLTKIFAGECNVMGGSAILNPKGRYYSKLKESYTASYEDNYWAEDAVFMERNSRDFVTRVERINRNAEAVCDILQADLQVKAVFYPKFVPSRPFYDSCRTPNGGYGGLLSVAFHRDSQAEAFFDRIDVAKGPSLGTNFTLASPYVILAHYLELEWAAGFGVESHLVRLSIGLEDADYLRIIFQEALKAAEFCE